ncbi:MAG: signal peptidase II [Sphingobacteriia bacterium]|nr:signal peptidase II [Sphingobacteriia bacterium]
MLKLKLRDWIVFITIIIVTAFLDLYTKKLAFEYVKSKGNMVEVLPILNLVTVNNHGISFGMFQNPEYGKIIFTLLALIISAYLIWNMIKENKLILTIATAGIVGGALGNVIDRIINGSVADFLDFHYREYHWPAFNLADSWIFIGVFIILLYDLFWNKKTKNTEV